MDKPRSFTYDKCSLNLFLDEGCLFQKMRLHSEMFPQSAPNLANTLFPFCSLIVHGSTRFIRRHFDSSFCLESQSINRLRNATKSLSSNGLRVEEYAEEAREITDFLSRKFKNHAGIPNHPEDSMRPDTGISYYNETPVFTTFNLSRYLAKYSPGGIKGVFDSDAAKNMGFDIGQAAQINYYIVEALGIGPSILEVEEFKLINKDFHYADLLKPISEHGLTNPIYFFLLCEGLMQLNSIAALNECKFFSELLEIKMTTAALVALEKSITKLSRHIMGHPEFESNSTRANSALSKIIPRERRKTIRNSKDLRNALVHYDFSKLLGEKSCMCDDAETILNNATQSTTKMTSRDYLDWLRASSRAIAANIRDLVMLPR